MGLEIDQDSRSSSSAISNINGRQLPLRLWFHGLRLGLGIHNTKGLEYFFINLFQSMKKYLLQFNGKSHDKNQYQLPMHSVSNAQIPSIAFFSVFDGSVPLKTQKSVKYATFFIILQSRPVWLLDFTPFFPIPVWFPFKGKTNLSSYYPVRSSRTQ